MKSKWLAAVQWILLLVATVTWVMYL